jgi:hypothetical protein
MALTKRRHRSPADQPRQLLFQPCGVAFCLEGSFPDGDDVPVEREQGGFVPQVAGLVALDLFPPRVPAGFWQAEVRAVVVAVPEAAVDEDDRAVFRQDEVGFAGEGAVFRAVDGEAVAEVVEHRAQGEFRFCVAPADAGHDLGSAFPE